MAKGLMEILEAYAGNPAKFEEFIDNSEKKALDSKEVAKKIATAKDSDWIDEVIKCGGATYVNSESKPRVRKIRFEGDASDKGTPSIWIKKGSNRDYTFEELALGRMILQKRGLILPDNLEERFQTLAEKSKRYTMTTTGTGTGEELTDTMLWQDLFEDIHGATLVADLFRPFIDMPAGKMELSEMGDAIFYKPTGEGVAVTATDLATAKRTLNAYTLKAQVDISDEENEDAIIGMLGSVRQTLVRNAAEVIDDVILNADTTTDANNINNYGTPLNADSRFLVGFNGLVHYALVEVSGLTSSVGTLAASSFATLLGKLGKYGDNPADVAFIIDRGVKNKAIQLPDFTTIDKMGAKATLLTGQIGQIYGSPVIMSSKLLPSDASGYVNDTAEDNTKGRIVAVNRKMWKVGLRRRVTVAAQRDEAKGITSLVCTMRIGTQCFGDRSSSDYCHTALGYNATV